MKFRLYRQFGALNSGPIFDAFEKGLKRLGHEVSDSPDAIPVIWSVLWSGRMERNREIYSRCLQNNVPLIIIEVGNLIRNESWRLSINHINRTGLFANTIIDPNRQSRFKLKLKPLSVSRNHSILITTQHEKSLQWEGMPHPVVWLSETVEKIRKYSSRPIVVRPHPRSTIKINLPGVSIQTPIKLPNTYDNFDIDYNYHCVINHNSGPAIMAAISGTPVICDKSSFAYPVSDTFENIENISLSDRIDWFSNILHTEWFIDEIEQGIPQERLISLL